MAAMPARRDNMSVVPTAPGVSFQPVSSHLAYPFWFSEEGRVQTARQLALMNMISDTRLHGTTAHPTRMSLEFSRQEYYVIQPSRILTIFFINI